jgi:hypothetical protein
MGFMKATSTRVALAVCFVSSCIVIFIPGYAPSIPDKVTSEEYELYSQWATNRFQKEPPRHLYFAARTFVFNPMERNGCDKALSRDGVSWSMIRAMHALGEAQYPLSFYDKTKLRIPWEYKGVDSIYDVPQENYKDYRYVDFSRVSFNNAHTEALFAVSDSCGGLCGGGGALLARRENGSWTFRGVGCSWMY